jgi:hypothetical protein
MKVPRFAAISLALLAAAAFAACGHDWGKFDFSEHDDAASSGGTGGSVGGASGSGGGVAGSGGTATGGSAGQGGCSNGKQDGNESDVDCGGACKLCADGKSCSSGSDCASSFCVDGVCCNTACADPCYACDDATAVGKCSAIAAGTDPDNECPTTDSCDGAGKCQCYNGTQDGSETGVDCGGSCPPCGGTCGDGTVNNGESDVDCGGPNCAKCAADKNCASPNDCATAVCATGKCCGPDPVPTTCAGKDCGNIVNNCGQSVSCGPACTAPDTCISNKCQCQDDGQACGGKACGSATNNCGQSVSCGTCGGATTVCLGNQCVACSPGATQTCQCVGTQSCSDAGAYGSCSGGADTQNDVENCGSCGNCCVPGCGTPTADYQCKCGQCYHAPTDCTDCASLSGCALSACQAAGAC